MDKNSFRFEARFGCRCFFVQSFVSFSTLFIFFGGFFFEACWFRQFFKKKKFSFLGLFRFMAPDFFLFLFLGSKSLGRAPSSLFPLLWLGIVRTFNRVIHHFSAARKKNSAAHRFRRRRRRCRHRRHHRGRKPFSAETATGTFPELSRLKNRKMKRKGINI